MDVPKRYTLLLDFANYARGAAAGTRGIVNELLQRPHSLLLHELHAKVLQHAAAEVHNDENLSLYQPAHKLLDNVQNAIRNDIKALRSSIEGSITDMTELWAELVQRDLTDPKRLLARDGHNHYNPELEQLSEADWAAMQEDFEQRCMQKARQLGQQYGIGQDEFAAAEAAKLRQSQLEHESSLVSDQAAAAEPTDEDQSALIAKMATDAIYREIVNVLLAPVAYETLRELNELGHVDVVKVKGATADEVIAAFAYMNSTTGNLGSTIAIKSIDKDFWQLKGLKHAPALVHTASVPDNYLAQMCLHWPKQKDDTADDCSGGEAEEQPAAALLNAPQFGPPIEGLPTSNLAYVWHYLSFCAAVRRDAVWNKDVRDILDWLSRFRWQVPGIRANSLFLMALPLPDSVQHNRAEPEAKGRQRQQQRRRRQRPSSTRILATQQTQK
eukprot:gene9996-10151_t